jgi:hypothetical protein
MTADDVEPSRFELAKELITELVSTAQPTEISLIVFS